MVSTQIDVFWLFADRAIMTSWTSKKNRENPRKTKMKKTLQNIMNFWSVFAKFAQRGKCSLTSRRLDSASARSASVHLGGAATVTAGYTTFLHRCAVVAPRSSRRDLNEGGALHMNMRSFVPWQRETYKRSKEWKQNEAKGNEKSLEIFFQKSDAHLQNLLIRHAFHHSLPMLPVAFMLRLMTSTIKHRFPWHLLLSHHFPQFLVRRESFERPRVWSLWSGSAALGQSTAGSWEHSGSQRRWSLA